MGIPRRAPKASESAPQPGCKGDGRKRNGQFGPGNQASKGVTKPGRSPGGMQRAVREFLEAPCDDDPKKRSLLEIAWATMHEALTSRDELGNPTGEAMRAVQLAFAYEYGRPREHKELRISNMALIGVLQGSIDARKAAELNRRVMVEGLAKEVHDGRNGKPGPDDGDDGGASERAGGPL